MAPTGQGQPLNLSPQAYADWRSAGHAHLLVDVRETPELAICQVEGAVHIPMRNVPEALDRLPRDVPLVVMCHHGMRSMAVVRFLREAGYTDVSNLDGGIDAWARLIDPSIALY